MRIFYCSHKAGVQGTPSQTWYNNHFSCLQKIADEIIELDFDLDPFAIHSDPAKPENREFIENNRPLLQDSLISAVRKAHAKKPIDLFFSYFTSAYCTPAAIEEIRKMGIVTMNWFCNASYQFHMVRDIAPAYDFCLVPEKFRLQDYHSIGANPVYCPEAANADFYRKLEIPENYELTFVGSFYGNRPRYLRKIYSKGLDVKIWGKGWDMLAQSSNSLKNKFSVFISGNKMIPSEQIGPFLPDKDLPRIFNSSKINLGFSVCGDTDKSDNPIKQVRLRDFEIPMSGGFYLAENSEELPEHFEPGKEIETFESVEECIDKSRYYLSHETERKRIREAGYRRAQADHKWENRFRKIFNDIGIFNKSIVLSLS